MVYHLLIFSSYLGSGGAEKHIVRLINSLNPNQFRITIVTPNKVGTYEQELMPHIRHQKIGSSLAFRISPTLARLTCILPLRNFVKRSNPQLVITVTDIHTLVYLRAVTNLTAPPKHIALVQNTISESYGKSQTPTRKYIFSAIPTWYSKADKIVALSQGVAHDLLDIAPHLHDRVTIIHNVGVDSALREQAKPTHLSINKPIIVACGRLVPQKGYPYLIEAFAKVVKTKPASLLILGEGEQREDIEKLIKHYQLDSFVKLLGFQKNPYAYMATADLFVLSSVYEGFGNVIVEAMACGAPVVATDCPHGPKEIINSGYNGLLVPIKDTDSLAQAILDVISDENLQTKLRVNGMNRAKDFEARKIALKYEKVIHEVLSI